MFTSQTTRSGSEMDSDDHALMESMLYKEQSIYALHDYFARSLPIAPVTLDSSDSMPVDPFCRNVMAKWCISLCKFCSYDRRMVASVMACVDRFVSTPNGSRILLERDQYQLAVMSSLYLVAKVQQTQALEPESIARLSRGKYTKADIETMELEILTTLKWFVNPPTPMSFAHEFLENFDFVSKVGNEYDFDESSSSSASTAEEQILELVNCQIQEATCDYGLSCLTRPSHVAFGAFSNALESMNIDSSDLVSMQMLKERLQIIDNDDVSAALLRVISSSETSNDPLSCLLLHRCSAQGKRSRRNSHNTEQVNKGQSFARTSDSSITSSPSTVAKFIHC